MTERWVWTRRVTVKTGGAFLIVGLLIFHGGCSRSLSVSKAKSETERLFKGPFSEGRYGQVIQEAERHLNQDDPLYKDAIYYMYQARRAQLDAQAERIEEAKSLARRKKISEVDEKATPPEEGAPRERSLIRRKSGFTEPPLLEAPYVDKALLARLNRKIPSLNIIDGEVDFILFELFKNTGVNIIADPGLMKGKKISLRLQDETILNILQYMAENQGFDYAFRDNTIWLTAPEEEKLLTRVFRLKHGFAASRLERDFQSLSDLSFLNTATKPEGSAATGGGRGSRKGGRTGGESEEQVPSALELFLEDLPKLVKWPAGSRHFVDKKKNLVIIRSLPETLEELEKLFQEIDINPVQILIETRFIEVGDIDDFDFGTEFNISTDRKKRQIDEGTGSFFGLPQAPTNTTGSNILLSGVMNGVDFQAAIFVLDRLESANTLSSPRVTTSNNSTATLAVVTNLVFIESFDVEFQETPVAPTTQIGQQTVIEQVPPTLVAEINDSNFTGIVLNVTPSVGADGKTITLVLQPVVRAVVDEIILQSTAVIPVANGETVVSPEIKRPIIETRFVNTQLAVEDGSTVVMGGLSTLRESTIENKIPFLGDIPILGYLFRRDTRTKNKKNLMIFVTTRILNEEGGGYIDEEVNVGPGSSGEESRHEFSPEPFPFLTPPLLKEEPITEREGEREETLEEIFR